MRRVRPSVASFGVVFAGVPVFGLFSTGMVVDLHFHVSARRIRRCRLRRAVGVQFLAGLFCFGRGFCLGSFFVQNAGLPYSDLWSRRPLSATWKSILRAEPRTQRAIDVSGDGRRIFAATRGTARDHYHCQLRINHRRVRGEQPDPGSVWPMHVPVFPATVCSGR